MRFLTVAVLAMTVSCATGYQPKGFTGGYEDFMINKDKYSVSFYGNGHTDKTTVRKYWLRRCAELTLEKGYSSFVIESSEAGRSLSLVNGSAINKSDMSGAIRLLKAPNKGVNAKEYLSQFKR